MFTKANRKEQLLKKSSSALAGLNEAVSTLRSTADELGALYNENEEKIQLMKDENVDLEAAATKNNRVADKIARLLS